MSRSNGYIYAVNGPVIKVKGDRDLSMPEMVYVGSEKLIGEVIGVEDEYAIVQVYEDTTSLRTGEEVKGTGSPLSATLAPGILSNIFDGIERPLKDIASHFGSFIGRGVDFPALDTEKKWDVKMLVKEGDKVSLSFGEGHKIFLVESKAKQLLETCPEYIGKEVIMGIRPEAIHDEPMYLSTLTDWTADAMVDVTELMGAEIYLYLSMDEDTNLIARVSSRSKAKSGDTVKVAFDITHAHFFDKETEKCISH